jgi:hypothetical protein
MQQNDQTSGLLVRVAHKNLFIEAEGLLRLDYRPHPLRVA